MKLDYKKEYKQLYTGRANRIDVVDVPELQYLMIDGTGDPNKTPEFGSAVQALYTLAYTIKFMVKKGSLGLDFAVMPLQGLWWMEDMNQFSAERKDEWLWTVMIMQPDFVTAEIYQEAVQQVLAKKKAARVEEVRLAKYHEGRSAQVLYLGPFADEEPTILKLHEYIHSLGCQRQGKHHEIYLSDPSRTAPEKLKTIIRQPMTT